MHQHEIEPPHLHGSSGLAGRLLSGAAMLVAVSSLVLSVYEARMTREHDRLSVWPSLQWFVSDSGGGHSLDVRNVGVGPAIVRSFQIRVDGHPRHNWREVVTTLFGTSPPKAPPGSSYSSFGRGSVLLPNVRVAVLDLRPGPLADALRALAPNRLTARICYCSLYQECWVLDDARGVEPAAVASCAAASPDDFAQ